jgi:hypothetical protein
VTVLVLDSGGLSRLAGRTSEARSLVRSLRAAGRWPPIVPTVVLVESLHGHTGHDANADRLLGGCLIRPALDVRLARRAALLRRLAGRGSAVDAVVVATAEPAGAVLTADVGDLTALAAHAVGVEIIPI